MVEQQPDSHPHIQNLLKWAERKRCFGAGGVGLNIDRPFIPDPEIKAYCHNVQPIKKLLEALFPDDVPAHVDPDTIRRKYAKVFLILLLTGHGCLIVQCLRYDGLSDRYLPFKSRPDEFPRTSTGTDPFTSFSHRQWEFCAQIFEYKIDLQLDDNLILPITHIEKLAGGGSAVVYRIKLHPTYDRLSRGVPSPEDSTDEDTHTYVLKTYNTPDAERYCTNEVTGFLNLSRSGHTNANIIGFHGSFVRSGTYNVLLEYADRGTLAQYFDTTDPPSSGEDTLMFYRGICKLLRALNAIHRVQPSDPATPSDTSTFQGWHQDIKLSNILVKSKKGGSPYECDFKMADFGLSHFKRRIPSQREATDRDTYGTRAYGAPECYRADSDVENISLQVSQSVDIWSLGSVLSEVAVWVVYGKGQLSEYSRRRRLETAQISEFRDGDCFHNGERVLVTVSDMHKTLARERRHCDYVTGAIVDMVTKEMLIKDDCRTDAKRLSYRVEVILQDAETELRRHASYAGTGRVSRTADQSPPRTPLEPPPGHVPSYPDKSRNQVLPSCTYSGILSYGSEADHQKPMDYFGKRVSQQAHKSRPIQRRISYSVDHPIFPNGEDQNHLPVTHMNRDYSGGPHWYEPPRTHRGQRQTPFLSAEAKDGPETSSQDIQENYNNSQCNVSTTAIREVPRSSNSPLLQDARTSPRAGQHRPKLDSKMQPCSLEPYSFPLPVETPRRRRPHYLSVTDAQQWKSDRKQHRRAKLPYNDLLADLKNRDHVFLIDNSSSMRSHRKEVCDIFGLLGYLVKGTDPDGIELCFTMSRDRGAKARDTGPLLRNLEIAPFSGESNIRTQLGEIFQDYHAKLREPKHTHSLLGKLRSPRPIRRQNVYILTDGVWQPNCDPTDLIKKLVKSLEQNSMDREQFGIQFIHFGDDPEGINRLNHLDSGLGLDMDIVDTEPSHGNVWKMLLGAINNWFDDDDVNASSRSVASSSAITTPGTNAFLHSGRRYTHT